MKVAREFMQKLAAAAAAQTLPRFRMAGLASDNKYQTGFDPVTEADREAERAIRELIAKAFPDHGIVGEEFGIENGDSRHLWIIDPIDGTRSFISGMPLWGTLVGFMEDGKAAAGMMSQPFIGEMFFADEAGCFYEGPGGARKLGVRQTRKLAEATLCTTAPALFASSEREAYDKLEAGVRLSRYSADCYAYAMLAAGNIDLVVEAGLELYDIAALVPIIQQAGGIITTWDGRPAEEAGNIVAAATKELHEAALEILNAG